MIFKVPEGVQHFPGGGGGGGGGPIFSRGVPIATHITCDFPEGGSGPPVPPSGSALGYSLNKLSHTTV